MYNPNPRLTDTLETTAIKPIDPTHPNKLIVESIEVPLDKYLDDLGLGDDSLKGVRKSRLKKIAIADG